MIDQLNREYEHLKNIQKQYALSPDMLDDYQETIQRIREIRNKMEKENISY